MKAFSALILFSLTLSHSTVFYDAVEKRTPYVFRAQKVNDSAGETISKNRVKFTKTKTKFCLSLWYNAEESHLYIIKTEICKN